MNAITMLERDHATFRRLLAQLDATTSRALVTRRRLFARIKTELTVHETIEEEVFYQALKSHPRAKQEVLEGVEEHHLVDGLLGEMTPLAPDDETWGAKANVMRENVEHHLAEEESDLFPMARRIFDPAELEDLGARLAKRRTTVRRSVRAIAAQRERSAPRS
jgi:hemerythrin superfamily protein